MKQTRHNASIRGNGVLYVLIGIAMFAALSFALAKNWAGLSKATTQDQARLIADEMIQYGNGLRTVVDRLMLLNKISDDNTGGNGILFSANGANAAYGVVGAQPTTEVFHASGGGATYQSPPAGACLSTCAYEFSGQYTVTGVSDDAKSELVMLVIDVDPTVCQMANVILQNAWTTTPTDVELTLTRFDGTNYGDLGGANAITITGGSNEFVNNRAFCFQEAAGGQRYIYLHVIRSR